jgi:pyruvate dehydrogenase complex dihydrolipoamide acetyltransferase long form
MIKELMIPNLGLTMEKAKILDWVKPEGGDVREEEIILVIETDKLSYEIPSPQKGFLHIIGEKGQDYPVGGVVGWVAQDRREYESHLGEKKVASPLKAPEAAREKEAEKKEDAPEPKEILSGKGRYKKVIASPLAKKVAKKRGIDLALVQGTGPRGRITKEDVVKALDMKKTEAPVSPKPAPELKVSRDLKAVREVIPIHGRRAVILKHMRQSLQEAAQMTHTMEVDASEFVRLRNAMLKRFEEEEIRISYNAILVQILGRVLQKYPKLNSSVDGGQMILWGSVHVGLAMDAEEGLIVPVIRNADQKGLKTIQKDIDGLIERVKTKRLMPDDIKGGTFTLSSLGYLDVEAFTPIINPPEVAILGVGKILEKPVVVNGEIQVGSRMMLSLTFDHRVIDGADAARFLQGIKHYVEEPYMLQGD